MDSKRARFILLMLAAWLVFCLSGCDAHKQLARLVKKHPELTTIDTLRDTVEVFVQGIDIDTVFEMSENVSGVDSILSSFGGKIDSLTALKLGTEIKYYITNRKVIEDTIYHNEDGVQVKIWQEANGLGISIHKPDSLIQEPVAIPYNPVVVVEEKNKVWPWIIENGLIFLVLLLLIYLIRKK